MPCLWILGGMALGASSVAVPLISTSTVWLAVAFAAGASAPRAADAAAAGAIALTFANLAFYGSGGHSHVVGRWFELGVAGGAVFGLLGLASRRGHPALRVGAAAVLAGVLVIESAGLRTHVLGPGVP